MDGQVYSSGVLDIYAGGQGFSDGTVLDNRIVTSIVTCARTTEVEYVFGPLAQVVEENRTTTGMFDPDMCFG